MCEIYHSVRALSRTLCEKYHTFLALKKQRRRSAYGRRSRGVFSACSPFSLTVTRSCTGRRVQKAAPYRRHGPRTGSHMGQYKSLSGECRRGRTPAGPSRSFCHSGATLIRLASLGTFPLKGGRLCERGKSLSPLSRCARHLPLIRGVVPSPTGFKDTFRVWVGEALGPPAAYESWYRWLGNPGAEIEPHWRQFLQIQGPVARREFRHPLKFCAPEIF